MSESDIQSWIWTRQLPNGDGSQTVVCGPCIVPVCTPYLPPRWQQWQWQLQPRFPSKAATTSWHLCRSFSLFLSPQTHRDWAPPLHYKLQTPLASISQSSIILRTVVVYLYLLFFPVIPLSALSRPLPFPTHYSLSSKVSLSYPRRQHLEQQMPLPSLFSKHSTHFFLFQTSGLIIPADSATSRGHLMR